MLSLMKDDAQQTAKKEDTPPTSKPQPEEATENINERFRQVESQVIRQNHGLAFVFSLGSRQESSARLTHDEQQRSRPQLGISLLGS